MTYNSSLSHLRTFQQGSAAAASQRRGSGLELLEVDRRTAGGGVHARGSAGTVRSRG